MINDLYSLNTIYKGVGTHLNRKTKIFNPVNPVVLK